MATLIDLVLGTSRVIMTSLRNAKQPQLSIVSFRKTNMIGVHSKIIDTTVRGSTGEVYNCNITFLGVKNPQKTLPSMSQTRVLVRCSCFTGDTLVMLPEGRSVPIKDLVGLDEFYVYAYDLDNKQTVMAKGHSARLTKKDAQCVKVTLDNGSEIKCTGDHLFLLKSGEWVKAEDLTSGTSLMAAYRSRHSRGYKSPRREIVSPGMQVTLEHLLADEYNLRNNIYTEDRGYLRHHLNCNPEDNSPSNIQRVTAKEHAHLHELNRLATSRRMKENNPMKNPETVRKVVETQTSMYGGVWGGKAVGFEKQAELGIAPWQKEGWSELKSAEMSRTQLRLAEEGIHNSTIRAKNGTHHFQTDEHSKKSSLMQCNRAKEGKHNFQHLSRETQMANLDKAHAAVKIKISEGTHSFQLLAKSGKMYSQTPEGKLKIRLRNLDLISKGKSPFQSQDNNEKKLNGRIRSFINKGTSLIAELLKSGKSFTPEDYSELRDQIEGGPRRGYPTYERLTEYSPDRDELLKSASSILNHKVVSVETVGCEDVYDLTVDEFHNFLIDVDNGSDCSSGVFVHNCKSYYFYFLVWNILHKCNIGSQYKKYVRKTPLSDKRYPERNPQHIVGACKHIIFLSNYLKSRKELAP